MKKFSIVFLSISFLFLVTGNLFARINKEERKVLFIGNSYTYVQNLPQLVSVMSDSSNLKLFTRKSTAGGAFLSDHWNNRKGLNSKQIIQNGHYDAVIIQGNSMEAVDQPDSTRKYVRLLCDLIRKSGAKPYLYMTWAREKVPQYQEQITRLYTELAKENHAILVPVGEAWKLARELRPTMELFSPDGSHPSALGALLSATVFVGVLTGAVPEQIPLRYQVIDKDGESVDLTRMDALDAVFFQKVAIQVLEKYGLK